MSSFHDALFKLPKTTFPQTLFPSGCITLYASLFNGQITIKRHEIDVSGESVYSNADFQGRKHRIERYILYYSIDP